MKLPAHIIEELLAEATCDQIEMWFILRRVKDILPTGSDEDNKRIALETVKAMLYSGRVDLACYSVTGFVRFAIEDNIEDVISKLDLEWEKLGKIPSIGDLPLLVAKQSF